MKGDGKECTQFDLEAFKPQKIPKPSLPQGPRAITELSQQASSSKVGAFTRLVHYRLRLILSQEQQSLVSISWLTEHPIVCRVSTKLTIGGYGQEQDRPRTCPHGAYSNWEMQPLAN